MKRATPDDLRIGQILSIYNQPVKQPPTPSENDGMSGVMERVLHSSNTRNNGILLEVDSIDLPMITFKAHFNQNGAAFYNKNETPPVVAFDWTEQNFVVPSDEYIRSLSGGVLTGNHAVPKILTDHEASFTDPKVPYLESK